MNKLLYVNQLNDIIKAFATSIGCGKSLEIKLDNEFAFYPNWEIEEEPLITYSLFETQADEFFQEYIKQKYGIKNVNIFTFSLLHEIGHYFTLWKMNPKVLNTCTKAKAKLSRAVNIGQKGCSPKKMRKLCFKYWNLPDEKKANDIAVKLLIKYPEEIYDFQMKISDALKIFYRVNKIQEQE